MGKCLVRSTMGRTSRSDEATHAMPDNISAISERSVRLLRIYKPVETFTHIARTGLGVVHFILAGSPP